MKGIYLMVFSIGVLLISLLIAFFTQNPISYYFLGAASLLFVVTLVAGIKARDIKSVHIKDEN